jgi:selenocysteine lyase/cysteine desulfurase
MVTMRLPWIREHSKPGVPHPIQQALAIEHRVEVPIVEWNDAMHVRASCHLYNTEEHVDRLIAALKSIRG